MTIDGSPVDLYRLLPAAGEAEIVHTAIRAGTNVLDLGSGTGRIARRLVELGHPVLAVDASPDMLAETGVPTVCARIEDLRLTRRFGGVLLASHLINTPDPKGLLATVRHHLADDGHAVIQWHPPNWFDTVENGPAGHVGPVKIAMADIRRENDRLSAVVHYRAGNEHWEQPFTAVRLSEQDLTKTLAHAGLTFQNWLTSDQTWFTATPH
ncbi:class I SAM-dependent methyltransferase [Actinokineospora sp. NBRC 105648]|uniref:class I SAM-dependent methyltransferase n=1 Tax=Actinokineospora sp. NBRC 105648 TaxID=3032206 RepID=UPI0024A1FF40|nr:class I SAM-dependent methyltransferase [Actinokineospora sp. NBRC 105648]GLZ39003.1 hypothetical protein Acsp05_26270 [Actinokineospora sp. NBRC 105648]